MNQLSDVPLEVPSSTKPERLVSLDAYRGFIMLVMASGGLQLAEVAEKFPESDVWELLAFHSSHVPWVGCSFWDLIQPSFMFMVGVALPYSYASRKARGDSEANIWTHAILRSLVLILLGVFLSSNGRDETNYTFVNVLTQIGLGYTFLYLFLNRGLVVQLLALLAVLGCYWYLFYAYPLPGPDFDYSAVGVPSDWSHHLSGMFAHWNKNSNVAHHEDVWLLNLFPRSEPFEYNSGGYQTLNFVPSFGTMLLGLMAGERLRSTSGKGAKLAFLIVAGLVCLGAGWAMGEHVCPLVKRIWTPSWTLFSSGWTFGMLAFFFLLIDMGEWKAWAFPFVVVGMNSIVMYIMAQLMKGWVKQTLYTHLGKTPFEGTYGPIILSASVLLVLWLICLYLYRQRIFFRI